MAAAALLSLRAYARHRKVSLAAVQKAVATGRLDKSVRQLPTGQKRIDQAIADLEWDANTDPSQRRSPDPQRPRAEQPLLFEGAAEPPTGTQVGVDERARSMLDAKRWQTLLKAKLLKLDLDEREHTLCDRASFESEALESGAAVRQAILNVPAQVRDELAATKDPHRVQQILEAALERALGSIATHYKQRARSHKVA